ncbi:hypothetical protein I3843_12G105000 [Carya illinoinensis]|nr:hypothetical protein I3760_12G103100 [Carya illinoinensis]KAG6634262.1 hypothetical protein CIPAW_12G106300 [Carya illinoinensis]KAG6685288.1 hypothetical protein I3842_12G104500 [Carya illinoinensis]KAG7953339.1 hypothetical protein I3843_12G105000 [Carya illinoinensis]KAG7953340.1 hypothetical protein I3843_12G105000 [Carya illinoinensis]
MNAFSHVPPGFRFHPTDEELVDYYLRKKIASKRIDLDVIRDVDLYKIEPWDLQELCKLGTDDQNEWYFFSHKDKKYPTGTRTNRATKAGFWKATGRDKAIYSRLSLIGMRKTLVFYKGRAPNGQKSDWIMHEYRLETNENGTSQEEGWVVCRVFKKRMTAMRKAGEYESLYNWYEEQVSFVPELDSPRNNTGSALQSSNLTQDQEQQHMMQIKAGHQQNMINSFYCNNEQAMEQVSTADWRVLDKFVASQLSHDHQDSSKDTNYSSAAHVFHVAEHMNMLSDSKRPETTEEFGSTSASSCQIDLWK